MKYMKLIGFVLEIFATGGIQKRLPQTISVKHSNLTSGFVEEDFLTNFQLTVMATRVNLTLY